MHYFYINRSLSVNSIAFPTFIVAAIIRCREKDIEIDIVCLFANFFCWNKGRDLKINYFQMIWK